MFHLGIFHFLFFFSADFHTQVCSGGLLFVVCLCGLGDTEGLLVFAQSSQRSPEEFITSTAAVEQRFLGATPLAGDRTHILDTDFMLQMLQRHFMCI